MFEESIPFVTSLRQEISSKDVKDDFQSVLRSLSTPILDEMRINVILYQLLTLYFWHFKFFCPTVSLIPAAKKLFHLVISERTKLKGH